MWKIESPSGYQFGKRAFVDITVASQNFRNEYLALKPEDIKELVKTKKKVLNNGYGSKMGLLGFFLNLFDRKNQNQKRIGFTEVEIFRSCSKN